MQRKGTIYTEIHNHGRRSGGSQDGNRSSMRLVKGAGQNNKIDPVHALLDALYCFDLGEGRVSE